MSSGELGLPASCHDRSYHASQRSGQGQGGVVVHHGTERGSYSHSKNDNLCRLTKEQHAVCSSLVSLRVLQHVISDNDC